jgi:hypothetical protein
MTKRILNEEEYWNMSYIKRVAVKIRSGRRPLIMGRRKGAEMVGIGMICEIFGVLFFGGNFREGVHT